MDEQKFMPEGWDLVGNGLDEEVTQGLLDSVEYSSYPIGKNHL